MCQQHVFTENIENVFSLNSVFLVWSFCRDSCLYMKLLTFQIFVDSVLFLPNCIWLLTMFCQWTCVLIIAKNSLCEEGRMCNHFFIPTVALAHSLRLKNLGASLLSFSSQSLPCQGSCFWESLLHNGSLNQTCFFFFRICLRDPCDGLVLSLALQVSCLGYYSRSSFLADSSICLKNIWERLTVKTAYVVHGQFLRVDK